MSVEQNREKWAKALESGEIPQIRGRMIAPSLGRFVKPEFGMCCLGVAQWLFNPGLLSANEMQRWQAGLQNSLVSCDVREALGLSTGDCSYFVDLNDNLGKSFTEIASEVRALPPVVA